MNVEAHAIRHVENLPAELDAVIFVIGHLPTFIQTQVEIKNAIAAQVVTDTRFAGIGNPEIVYSSLPVLEQVDDTVAILVRTC